MTIGDGVLASVCFALSAWLLWGAYRAGRPRRPLVWQEVRPAPAYEEPRHWTPPSREHPRLADLPEEIVVALRGEAPHEPSKREVLLNQRRAA